MIKNLLSRQIVKYGIVGSVGMGLDFLLLYFLVEYLHLFYLAAAGISIMIIFVGCFTVNKYWTFEDRNNKYFSQMGQYLLAHLVGLGINLIILYSLVEFLGIWYIFAKIFATMAAFLWNFFIAKRWVFQKSSRRQIIDEA